MSRVVEASRTFVARYTWGYWARDKNGHVRRRLRQTTSTRGEWVPDADGNLLAPELVVFDTLGWEPNPFLSSKNSAFKPASTDQLAKEVGIEPGALNLLKELGLTSEADLRERLDVKGGTHTPQRGQSRAISRTH